MDDYSKLTQKFQATIPAKIRKLLGLKRGDTVGFFVRGEEIILKKAGALDLAFAKSLEGTLSEWASVEDEEAYHDF